MIYEALFRKHRIIFILDTFGKLEGHLKRLSSLCLLFGRRVTIMLLITSPCSTPGLYAG